MAKLTETNTIERQSADQPASGAEAKKEKGEERRRGDAVPSLYSGHDPEFSRPIFRRKRRDVPRKAVEPRIEEKSEASKVDPSGKSKPRMIDLTRQLSSSPVPLKTLPTGILALDNRTGGFSVGSFNCISGVDRVERTKLLVHIAERVAADGGRVLAFISPNEEAYWAAAPNLMVNVSAARDLETIAGVIESLDTLDLVVVDPLHAIQTPRSQERVAAMDNAAVELTILARRKRAAVLAASHLVDRATHHGGVSLHPWMFRDISCLLELSELILLLRHHFSGRQEILVYRRGHNDRIGGLPSFVIPWD